MSFVNGFAGPCSADSVPGLNVQRLAFNCPHHWLDHLSVPGAGAFCRVCREEGEFRDALGASKGVLALAVSLVGRVGSDGGTGFVEWLSGVTRDRLLCAVVVVDGETAPKLAAHVRFHPDINARISIVADVPSVVDAAVGRLQADVLEAEQLTDGVAASPDPSLLILDRELLFGQLMDNLPNHIYFKDLESRFLVVNKAMARWVGWRPEELRGKTDADLFSKSHAQEAREDELRIIRGEVPRIIKEEREDHLDGRVTWVTTTKLPLYSTAGELVGTYGISRDITARKKAEFELRRERNLLRTLVDMLPFRVFVKNLHGEYLLSNTSHRKLLGVREESDLKGRKLTQFFPGENGLHSFSLDKEVLGKGVKLLNREERDLLNPEPDHWILSSRVPLRDDEGHVIGLVGASMDITKRKQAEMKLQAYHEQMEDDLAMARNVQTSLLPAGRVHEEVTVCSQHERFKLAYTYLPCEALAGDFLQQIPLDDNKIGVLVADVMGHGVRAALVAALMTGLVDELLPHADSPGDFMTRLNAKIASVLQQTGSFVFISACYAVVDLGSQKLHWVSAGHPRPFVLDGGEVAMLGGGDDEAQPALSVSPGHRYKVQERDWDDRSRLFVFSDGIVEARNDAGEEFSVESLGRVLRENAEQTAERVIAGVLSAVRHFTHHESLDDDVCMVLLEAADGE